LSVNYLFKLGKIKFDENVSFRAHCQYWNSGFPAVCPSTWAATMQQSDLVKLYILLGSDGVQPPRNVRNWAVIQSGDSTLFFNSEEAESAIQWLAAFKMFLEMALYIFGVPSDWFMGLWTFKKTFHFDCQEIAESIGSKSWASQVAHGNYYFSMVLPFHVLHGIILCTLSRTKTFLSDHCSGSRPFLTTWESES
jgi:hypothetical protein